MSYQIILSEVIDQYQKVGNNIRMECHYDLQTNTTEAKLRLNGATLLSEKFQGSGEEVDERICYQFLHTIMVQGISTLANKK